MHCCFQQVFYAHNPFIWAGRPKHRIGLGLTVLKKESEIASSKCEVAVRMKLTGEYA